MEVAAEFARDLVVRVVQAGVGAPDSGRICFIVIVLAGSTGRLGRLLEFVHRSINRG